MILHSFFNNTLLFGPKSETHFLKFKKNNINIKITYKKEDFYKNLQLFIDTYYI